MKEATALYHPEGSELVWGEQIGVIVVDADEVEAKLADGWFLHPDDAINAKKTTPTRAELEQKATELEIKFDGRTTNKKLSEAIDEKLKASNVD